MSITKNKWFEMSNQEKYKHLTSGNFKVNKRSGVDPKSIVGDSTVTTYYQGEANGVTISAWYKNLTECLTQSANNINAWLEPESNKDGE